LLFKHPEKVQAFEVSSGAAYVFYPEAGDERATAALLLEVDPVGLVRGGRGGGVALGQYVNDRPYAASSLLAVALKAVFRTAMTGRCDARPELAGSPLPLSVRLAALPCRGGPELARRLFEPLGWSVDAAAIPLDETVPGWGDSPYVDLRLDGELRLADALNHLYVLLPVLDDAKHYWVGPDEVDKLIRAGTGWLAAHPDKSVITRRYLRRRAGLTREAVSRLAEVDDTDSEHLEDPAEPEVGDEPDRAVPLAEQRRGAVLAALRGAGAARVVDLGCGDGKLLRILLAEDQFTEVLGVDVSVRALQAAGRTLHVERMPERNRARLQLLQSSLTYRDERLVGVDAAVLMEVVEHIDPPRLPALERVVFGEAAPGMVLVTTPNVEYNALFEGLSPGAFRHRDHRFEWGRAEFREWAEHTAAGYGYRVRILSVGPEDPELGAPSQLAVFDRQEEVSAC
jgi:3' terminal RNA ribose 2'-O-methyltransferase Hen1